MKKEDIYRSLEYVRDEYLESAADAMSAGAKGKKAEKRRYRRYIGIAAACLVLACAVGTVSLLRDSLLFGYETVQYSASDIAEFMNTTVTMGTPTNQYTKVHLRDAGDLQLNELPKGEYLPIYRLTSECMALDEEELLAFADDRLERLTESMGIGQQEFILREIEDSWLNYYADSPLDFDNFDPDNAGYFIGAAQNKLTETIGVEPHFCPPYAPYIQLDGERIAIRYEQSDDEIIASLSSIKEKLFDIFDESFKDTKVLRDYDEDGISSVSVYFYNADDHRLNETSEHPVSNHISLYFRNVSVETAEDDLLTYARIDYYKYRVKPSKVRTIIAKAKTLSLNEAEKLLEKGYVFGGHSCRLCTGSQDKVDFTDYDYVSFEYLNKPVGADDDENGFCGLPFYTFYKYIGTAKNGNQIYAKTYVPAIEVSGIEEYFEQQTKNHQ